MSMDNAKLDHFKEILTAELNRLEQELAALGSKDPNKPDAEYEIVETGSNSEDDNAAEIAEYVDELTIEARTEAELRDVKKALASIDSGKYGVCKYCGNPIDEKRLEARPASSSCISCKKTLTQEM